MNLEYFLKKYLNFKSDINILKYLNKIIKNNNYDLNKKQLEIEKLMNVYYLDKEQKKYILNPLWWNEIEKIFVKEYYVFEEMLVSDIKLNIKSNYFKNLQLLFEMLRPKELFSLFIYTYLELETREDYLNIKVSTLNSRLVEHIWRFFNWKFRIFLLSDYLKINKLKFKEKFTFDVYKEIINNSNWNFLLRENLKLNKLTNYTIEKKYFDDFVSTEEEKIKLFLYKIVEHVYKILVDDINVIKINLVNHSSKSYNYCELFDISKFSMLSSFSFMNNNLPMLVPPLNWNYNGESGGYILNKKNNYMSLVKKLKKGISHISFSKYQVDSINLVQQKVYKIHKKYLLFYKTNIFKKSNNILTTLELYNLYLSYEQSKKKYELYLLDNKYNRNIIYTYKSELKSLYLSTKYRESDKIGREKLFNELKFGLKINDDLFKLYTENINSKVLFLKELSIYKNNEFNINLLTLYDSLSFYNISRFDFRTRFFPVGRSIHRASGIYKYCIIDESLGFKYSDFTLKKLKEFCYLQYDNSMLTYTCLILQNKFDNLVNPYLNSIDSVLEDLELLLSTINNDDIKIYSNPSLINLIINSKEPCLFLFGIYDYFSYLKNKDFISFLSIDYDQCSSGPMIYSLLSNDVNMGNLTNIYPTNFELRKDLYLDFLEHFYIKLDNITFPDTIKDIQVNKRQYFDRKFSKLFIMPTFYNMGKEGIKNLLVNYLKNKFPKHICNLNIYLAIFIPLLTNLVNELYTETISFQREIVKVSDLLFKKHDWISISTLDGSVIRYKYLSSVDRFGKIYKNGKPITYRVYLNPIEVSQTNKITRKQVISFPPNLIHSIDGCLCRIIISLFYKLYNIILEPLHDSVRLPFYLINKLVTVIKYIYSYYFFYDFFHQFKIGIENDQIIFNSKNYNHYNELLPKSDFNGDILNYTIFRPIKANTSIDIYEELVSELDYDILYNDKKINKLELFNKFLHNNYFFYF